MRVSYSWLQEYIPLDINPQDLSRILTLLGLEVDYVENLEQQYRDLIIGEVIKIARHPQRDNLLIVEVNIKEATVNVVCGADNFKIGDKVVLAPVNGVLPDGRKIEEVEIAGIKSKGMLCALDELNLSEKKQNGIMVLAKDAPVGQPFVDYMGLNDSVLTLDLTPNYGHALSMIGIARELAAISGKKINYPKIEEEKKSGSVEDFLEVEIENPQLCPRYTARVIEGVTVKESPWWLQKKLLACGIRPVNNIVDITNYVMLELGQPLHAFDFDQVAGKKIIVRCAQDGEKLITLDQKERLLKNENLIIADQEKPLALAGVMGGLDSEVTPETKNILLEAAVFDPISVRKTSKQFALHSSSAHRFQRGVDIVNVTRASLRAAQLIAELGGGELIGGIADNYPQVVEPLRIKLRPDRVNDLLGTDISRIEMKNLLEKLQFKVKDSKSSQENFWVFVPSFRHDIEIEADLIEEIARTYGYDKIPIKYPAVKTKQAQKKEVKSLTDFTNEFFRGCGFDEIMTLPLTNQNHQDDEGNKATYKLLNPLSSELSNLRLSILENMIQAAIFNTRRQAHNLRFFEIGKVFLPDQKKAAPLEQEKLTALIMEKELQGQKWHQGAEQFFTLKGVLESYLEKCNLTVTFSEGQSALFHSGRQANILLEGTKIGIIGELHPVLKEEYKFVSRIALMELDFSTIKNRGDIKPFYRGVPRFPSVERDLAFVVAEQVKSSDLKDLITQQAGSVAQEVSLFDLYRGQQIAANKKSLAYRISFRSLERTLTDQEVDQYIKKVVQEAKEQFDADLRQ